MNCQFNQVVVAGTFDRLHEGHQQLLQTALNAGRKVWCGLTVPQMNKNKILSATIQSYLVRENTLKSYHKKITIFPLSDPFGPAVEENGLQAIVASVENQPAVARINQERTKKKLKALYPLYVNLSDAEDHQKISSTRIRLGEINRGGRVFSQIFNTQKIVLPTSQRRHFQKPFGQLWRMGTGQLDQLGKLVKLNLKEPTPLIITVGDIITQAFRKLKLASLAVIDYRTQRQPITQSCRQNLPQVDNPAGTLTLALVKKFHSLLTKIIFTRQSQVLEILGEEDLTVLPAILLSPLQSLVFYGQPNEGVVKIRVTEKKKEQTYQLLQKFNM